MATSCNPHTTEALGNASVDGRGGMDFECRMDRPFWVGLAHDLTESPAPPEGHGAFIVFGGGDRKRYEEVTLLASQYDWLRGGHAVRLHFTRGEGVRVEGAGADIQIPVWCGKPAQDV